jgi:hypothetical protein
MFYLLSFWGIHHVDPFDTSPGAAALGKPLPRQEQHHVAALLKMDQCDQNPRYLTMEQNHSTP